MKVAISINTAWNIYNFRLGLIKSLLAEGHEIIAIAPSDEYVSKLVSLGCSFEPVKIDNTGANPLKDILLIYRYQKIFKRIKPDIILQYTIKPNIYGTLAAKHIGIPVINNVSGLGTVFLNNGLVSRIAQYLYKTSFRKVDLTFFQNEDDEHDFKKAIDIKDLKSDQLPGSGIDLARFKPQKQKPPNGKFVFLMVSRLIIEKGVNEYVEAANLLQNSRHDVKCILVGKIDLDHKRSITEEQLQNWISKGYIEYHHETEEIMPIIAASDCMVLPSYREGTPKTLLEGAAMAKPLLATDVPGCRNVVKEGVNGYLCAVKNGKDLYQVMSKMLTKNRDELHEMGMNSRKIAEDVFDEKIVINKYLHWIDKILEPCPQ